MLKDSESSIISQHSQNIIFLFNIFLEKVSLPVYTCRFNDDRPRLRIFLLHWGAYSTLPHSYYPFSSSSSNLRRRPAVAISSPSLMFPSAEELQVELTLLELADLILERRRIPPPGDYIGFLRWRGGKPRSVASRRRRPLRTPSLPPPLDSKEGDAAAAATAASSSPSTPLSFQESGTDEVSVRPDPEAEHRKRHREVSLPPPSGGEEGALLTEPMAEHGKRRRKLIAREDRKSFSNTSSSIFSYQSHQARVQPTGGGHREQQSVGAVTGLPDLNVCAVEKQQQQQQQQQQDPVRWWKQRQQQLLAYRAATSLARRRRVQIQREKRFSLLSYNSK
ncbi:uncharacterized protein LOC122051660 isoform X2 [Zingiber officinale]|uniref:uncharacterized protein LOC122051660 isoform X2 n=1 Tax=Zingiber officinale TaxID=94328 RepID=UPI001C4CFB33|nr:uncharacterized protein LOC122051660 isoform X2 [Zingiber officinale]